MLIYQGINFLFFTESSFSGTAYGIAIPVGLLALGVLLDLIFTKKLINRAVLYHRNVPFHTAHECD